MWKKPSTKIEQPWWNRGQTRRRRMVLQCSRGLVFVAFWMGKESSTTRNDRRVSNVTTAVQHCPWDFSQSNEARKEIKGTQIGKKEVKWALHRWGNYGSSSKHHQETATSDPQAWPGDTVKSHYLSTRPAMNLLRWTRKTSSIHNTFEKLKCLGFDLTKKVKVFFYRKVREY